MNTRLPVSPSPGGEPASLGARTGVCGGTEHSSRQARNRGAVRYDWGTAGGGRKRNEGSKLPGDAWLESERRVMRTHPVPSIATVVF